MRLTLAIFITFTPAWAADYYYAPTSAGSNNGASCSHAWAYTDLTNGINTVEKWQPGNNLYLCPGTYTKSAGANAITSQGPGSSGHPITIKFETGAKLEAPYWATGNSGAIYINHAYVTVDGGTNGTIRNTLNGDTGAACLGGACAYRQPSNGIKGSASAHHMTVQNMTVTDMYIRVPAQNTGTDDTMGIQINADYSRITRNTVSKVATGVSSAGGNHIEIDHNTVSICNHCLTDALVGTGSTQTDVLLHDNEFSGGCQVYDSTNNYYHRNAMQIFLDNTSCANCTITGLQIYNNWFRGRWSDIGQMNSHIFIDDSPGSPIQGYAIFNNIFDQDVTDSGFACGYICQSQNGTVSGNVIANNTVAPHLVNNGSCSRLDSQTNLTLKNNIFKQCGYGFYTLRGSLTTPSIDRNLWYSNYNDPTGWFGWPPSCTSGCSWTNWRAAGFDVNGQHGQNPRLNADYTLQAESPAITTGENLTALADSRGIAALKQTAPSCFGVACFATGVARPAAGNWDIGAYQYGISNYVSAPASVFASVY